MKTPISTTPLKPSSPATEAAAGNLEDTLLARIKHSYLTFLSEMDYDLEDGFKYKLADVTAKVENATTEQDLIELGVDLKNLISIFARLAFGMRSEATQLVNEIFEGLAKVESRLQVSASHVRQIHSAGRILSESVSENIVEMNQQVDTANDISQLKQMVAEKLVQFQKTVNQYHLDEQKHIKAITAELDSLRKEFKSANDVLNQLKSEKEYLAHKARTDSLTGAFNRLAMEERLQEEMEPVSTLPYCFQHSHVGFGSFQESQRHIWAFR